MGRNGDGKTLQARFAALDLNLLVTLEGLLEVRSVTETAERFGVTQSAMSHRLGRLRDFFDDPLLVSTGDALVLTPKAQSLQAPLSLALRELRSAVLADSEFDPRQADRAFVLAGADLAEVTLLPPLIRRLEEAAPRVTVRMAGRGFASADALTRGKVDVAIAPGRGTVPGVSLGDAAGVRQRIFVEEGFSVLVRRDHPRLRGRLTLKRFLEETHVLVSPQGAPGGVVDLRLAKEGHKRRVVIQVASFLSGPFVVAQSDHLLTCPTSLAKAAVEHLPLRMLKPPIDLPSTMLFLYWHERMHHDPGHTWFREQLFQMVSEREPAESAH